MSNTLDVLHDIVDQWADLSQANGVDTSEEGEAVRKGLKENIDIFNAFDQAQAKKEDARAKREFEHQENMARIEMEREKNRNECILKGTGIIVTGVCVGMTVYSDATGRLISKVGQTVLSTVTRVIPWF